MREKNVKKLLTEAVKSTGSTIKAMELSFDHENDSNLIESGIAKIKCSSSEAEKEIELDKLNIEFTEEHRIDYFTFNVHGTIYLEDKSHILVYIDSYHETTYGEIKYIAIKHIKQIDIPKELL